MKYIDKTCTEFIDELASKAAVPGGGGASAYAGALGVALGMMVGNLTVGKQSYADVESEMKLLLKKSEQLKSDFLRLVDADAEAFKPLAKAYSIPKDDPSRAQVMEDALRLACTVPMEIMSLCGKAIDVCEGYAKYGNRQAMSDAGISALFCKAAMQGASLNVFINTKYMDNRTFAKRIDAEAFNLLETYCPKADSIYNGILSKCRGETPEIMY